MFKPNKYTRWYDQLMERAKARSIPAGYVEKHHVIPSSLGGSSDKVNLRYLTAREHYIAHLLLTKMVEGKNRRNMAYALSLFNTGCKNHLERVRPTGRLYEYSRKLLSETMKGMGFPEAAQVAKVKALKGKKLSAEHLEKMSKALKRPLSICLLSPTNERIETHDVVEFFTSHGLSAHRPYRLTLESKGDDLPRVINNGKSRGWVIFANSSISTEDLIAFREVELLSYSQNARARVKLQWEKHLRSLPVLAQS